jgi:hypothetical protein
MVESCRKACEKNRARARAGKFDGYFLQMLRSPGRRPNPFAISTQPTDNASISSEVQQDRQRLEAADSDVACQSAQSKFLTKKSLSEVIQFKCLYYTPLSTWVGLEMISRFVVR